MGVGASFWRELEEAVRLSVSGLCLVMEKVWSMTALFLCGSSSSCLLCCNARLFIKDGWVDWVQDASGAGREWAMNTLVMS